MLGILFGEIFVASKVKVKLWFLAVSIVCNFNHSCPRVFHEQKTKGEDKSTEANSK